MSFLKNIFNSPKQKESKEDKPEIENLSLDEIFVQNFISNKGKFLYCTSLEEVTENLSDIVQENKWEILNCNDVDLLKLCKKADLNTANDLTDSHPFFVGCEHLIAENGSILFSSNQLKECKISELPDDFIVYATTSQLVRSKGESLTGIKSRYQGNIPSNISAIKNYSLSPKGKDFMSYGNTNTKNLYLLLFEDL
jgi:L-lactate utilization protein LutC